MLSNRKLHSTHRLREALILIHMQTRGPSGGAQGTGGGPTRTHLLTMGILECLVISSQGCSRGSQTR